MQTELTQAGPLLQPNGQLAQVGWARQPILDCNLEAARFYALTPLQRFRIKRWDYYAVFKSAAFLLCHHRRPRLRRQPLRLHNGF